ncbi:hypothetical protein SISNIDRAFT_482255 [Sistotremastrum niveocremeum HHB9708]|uniref:Uncharacterized protein n=1 Tax=Sistotremastrum niveocremeum HHB9708 TaxID=1314777 RepID=A0A164YXR8_9AGAM|nr:hypothetical protein SISNIDRAFT_482255 [Sistotremastrum niveocremeum HHB9708]
MSGAAIPKKPGFFRKVKHGLKISFSGRKAKASIAAAPHAVSSTSSPSTPLDVSSATPVSNLSTLSPPSNSSSLPLVGSGAQPVAVPIPTATTPSEQPALEILNTDIAVTADIQSQAGTVVPSSTLDSNPSPTSQGQSASSPAPQLQPPAFPESSAAQLKTDVEVSEPLVLDASSAALHVALTPTPSSELSSTLVVPSVAIPGSSQTQALMSVPGLDAGTSSVPQVPITSSHTSASVDPSPTSPQYSAGVTPSPRSQPQAGVMPSGVALDDTSTSLQVPIASTSALPPVQVEAVAAVDDPSPSPQAVTTSSAALPLSDAGAIGADSGPSKSAPREETTQFVQQHVVPAATFVWDGLKTLTSILRECTDFHPVIKAAAGGAVALMEALELPQANRKKMDEIIVKIQEVNEAVKISGQENLPSPFKDRLNKLANALETQTSYIELKRKNWWPRRLLQGKRDAADVNDSLLAIVDACQLYQLGALANVEVKVEETLSVAGRTEDMVAQSLATVKENAAAIRSDRDRELLSTLRPVEAARFDIAYTGVLRNGCTKGTRESILQELMFWSQDASTPKIYWLNF